MSKMSRVAAAMGHCAVNYHGLVSRIPEHDGSTEIAEFSQQGGGAAATAVAALACLGERTRFIGKVSDDHFGAFLRRGLETLGVDLAHLVVERDRVSPFAYVAVEKGSGRRRVYWTRGSVTDLRADEVDLAGALTGSSVLMLDGTLPMVQLEAARTASDRGITVVWDAHMLIDNCEDLLRSTDVLLASERFAMEIAPSSALERSLETLGRMGPSTCIITLGPEGAIGVDRGGVPCRVPALQVDIVDTTAAGHVYCGAFVYAMMQGWPLTRSMGFASTAAGLKCRHLGPRAGMPDLADVLGAMESLMH
jgi:sugar/nucleoside kinase (ribokinase family)